MDMQNDVSDGTAEVLSQYNYILKEHPSINPTLIDMGCGKVARDIDARGRFPSMRRAYYDGHSMILEGYLSLDVLKAGKIFAIKAG
jgi:hypothetical protein